MVRLAIICVLVAATTTLANPWPSLSERQDTSDSQGQGVVTVPLIPFSSGDGSYFGVNVSIGTPPQPFTLALTLYRNAVVVIPPSFCYGGCPNNTFTSTASSTFVSRNANSSSGTWFWKHRAGPTMAWTPLESYTATLGGDSLHIGGADVPNATISIATSFEDARHPTYPGNLEGKGVLALGYTPYAPSSSTLNPPVFAPNTNGWVGAALGSPGVTNPWKNSGFGISVNPDPSIKSGSITFGGYDESKFRGVLGPPVETVPSEQTWAIPVENITVNGYGVSDLAREHATPQLNTFKPPLMLMDPTFDMIQLPTTTLQKIMRLTAGSVDMGSGDYTVPCDKPPALAFTFGGVVYPMETGTWLDKSRTDGRGGCYTFFVGSDSATSSNDWAMGPLMRNLYAYYEVTDKAFQIRLATTVGKDRLATTAAATNDGIQATGSPAQSTNAGNCRTISWLAVLCGMLVATL